MDSNKKVNANRKCMKFCSTIGGFLLVLPTGWGNIWGNISVYVLSYLYTKQGMRSGLDTPWILSLYLIGLNIGMNLSGRIPYFGRRARLALDIVLFTATQVAVYFALTYGLVTLMFITTLLIGICVGITESTIFESLAEWPVSERAMMISIACSGMNCGRCIINPLASVYLNPENLSPDVKLGELIFFTQQELIDKVPSVFLLIAAINLVCMTVGYFLLELIPKHSTKGAPVELNGNYGSVETRQECGSDTIHRDSCATKENNTGNAVVSTRSDLEDTAPISTVAETSKVDTNVTPLQLLRRYEFYILLFLLGCQELSNLLINNYYKLYGQIWIQDDYLLAGLGSIMGIVGGVARLLWGFCLDRFRIKTCWIMMFSAMPFFALLSYFTPMINKWLYCIAIVSYVSIRNCGLPTSVISMLTLFGDRHFNKNLGLAYCGMILSDAVAPLIFQLLLAHFGWFYIFFFTAALTSIALVLVVFLFPKAKK